ncbi:hypothetical protein BH11PSE6_BH11PSE6_26760 [soil metagenome]
MIVFHSLPKAARRFLTAKLLAELRRLRAKQYYEPMQLLTVQPPGQLPILFEPAGEPLCRFDLAHLRKIDFSFGVFAAERFQHVAGDYSFTFIRHPVDRFYSAYYYGNHHLTCPPTQSGVGTGRVRYRERYPEMVALFSQDLAGFVRQFLDCDGQIRFDRDGTIYGPIDEIFYLPKNLGQHDMVGVVESMDQSLDLLNAGLGTRIANDRRINQGPARPARPWGRAALTRFFADDIATFERYRAKLAASPGVDA